MLLIHQGEIHLIVNQVHTKKQNRQAQVGQTHAMNTQGLIALAYVVMVTIVLQIQVMWPEAKLVYDYWLQLYLLRLVELL